MHEFAFIALVFLGFIGLVFDLGLGMYRYSILTHATTSALREATSGRLDRSSCSPTALTAEAEEMANKQMTDLGYGPSRGYSFLATTQALPVSGGGTDPNLRTLKITGQWKMSCAFCVLLGTQAISSVSTGYLEFPCNG